jgi:hypothetical protein
MRCGGAGKEWKAKRTSKPCDQACYVGAGMIERSKHTSRYALLYLGGHYNDMRLVSTSLRLLAFGLFDLPLPPELNARWMPVILRSNQL